MLVYEQQYVKILAEGLPRRGQVGSSSQFASSLGPHYQQHGWKEITYILSLTSKIAESQARSTTHVHTGASAGVLLAQLRQRGVSQV